MNNGRTAPPLAVPILLAVFGIGALATAILLVMPMVERLVAARAEADVSRLPASAEGRLGPGPSADLPPPVPAAVPDAGAGERARIRDDQGARLEASTAPSATVASEQPVAQADPAPAAPASGEARQWVIDLDPASYEMGPPGDTAVDEIIAALNADAGAKVLLTGVNHPNKSSKRAERAAKAVKERIAADVGIVPARIRTASFQDTAVEGLIVRAVIEGGGR